MGEVIVLDPPAVAADRFELDITPWIKQEGIDFGDAAISAYMSEGAIGELPVDFRVPNRLVTIPLNVFEWNGVTFDELRTLLQGKAALFQVEGGFISRETAVGIVYADVVNATLKLGGGHLQALGLADTDVVLTLECLPEWWGDEIEGELHTAADGESELVFVETNIGGNYPARARLEVNDLSGDDQNGLICAVRSRHYDDAPTAASVYEAEDLTPGEDAAVSGNGTASGESAILHPALDTEWTTVLSTNLDGEFLTQTGSYRVIARVASGDGTDVSVRWVWDVGDLTWPTRNAQVKIPADTQDWYLLDLGEIRLDRIPVGAHRWKGLLEAKGAAGGEEIYVDKLWFFNVDEGFTKLRAVEEQLPAPDTSIAFDAASSSAYGTGTLSWTHTPAGTPKGVLVLIMQDDSATDQVTSVTYGGVAMSEVPLSPFSKTVASDGKLYGYFLGSGIPTGAQTITVNVSGGSPKRAAAITVTSNSDTAVEDTSTVKQVSGDAVMSLTTNYETVVFAMSMAHKNDPGDFNPGANYTQVLEHDFGTKTGLWERGIANFAAGSIRVDWAYLGSQAANAGFAVAVRAEPLERGVIRDAVIYATGSVELRYDGHFRTSDDGDAYGPVPYAVGDLFRVPPAGLEGRAVEVLVKTSRGDLLTRPDSSIDPISARLMHRRCWLYLPTDDDLGSS